MPEPTPTQEELERKIEALHEQLERWERRRRNAWHRRLLRWVIRPRNALGLALAALLIPLAAYAVTIPNTFVNGTLADADEVNANFNAVAASINLHEPNASAHHAKTIDASELIAGTLPDLRLSPSVSLLGPAIAEGELEFDTANQAELDGHLGVFGLHTLDASAHHSRYDDTEAVAAVGPHVTSVDGLAGGNISSDVSVAGLINSETDGYRFPDGSNQVTAFVPGVGAVFPNRILVAPSGGDFTSIQAAIDSVTPTAGNPYLIDIAPGTYTEDLLLKSHLHLRGAGIQATTIANAGAVSHVDANGVTNVKLSQLTIFDDTVVAPSSDYGVDIDATSQVELEDVQVDGHNLAVVRVLGGDLSARRVQLGSNNVDRALFVDQGATAHIVESMMTGTGNSSCAVEVDQGDLTLVRTDTTSFSEVCSDTLSASGSISIRHSRLWKVRIRGDVVFEMSDSQVVNNDFFTPVSIESGVASRIVGNRIVGAVPGVGALLLSGAGGAQIVGNHIESGNGPAIGIVGTVLEWVIVANQLKGVGAVIDGGPGLPFPAGIVIGNLLLGGDGELLRVQGTVLGNTFHPDPTSDSGVDGWTAPNDLAIIATRHSLLSYGNGPDPSTFTISGPAGTLAFDPATGASLTAGGSTLTMDATGAVSISAAGDLDLTATGALNLAGASVAVTATTGLLLTGNTVDVGATTKFKADGGAAIDLTASGEIDITSSAGLVDVNGSLITVN